MTSQIEATQNDFSVAQPNLELPAVKDIHIQADELVKEIVAEFENALRLQANTLARNDEIVLSSHVREAFTILRRENSRKWTEELPILFGGTLFGAFLSGFPTEISVTTLRPLWISVYVILGLIGAFLVFYGFMKQYSR